MWTKAVLIVRQRENREQEFEDRWSLRTAADSGKALKQGAQGKPRVPGNGRKGSKSGKGAEGKRAPSDTDTVHLPQADRQPAETGGTG